MQCEGRDLSLSDIRSLEDSRLSESEWQRELIGIPNGKLKRPGIIQLHGYEVVHIFGCVHYRYNAAGLPDLHLRSLPPLSLRSLIVAELKTMKGVVTEQQALWLDAYAWAGVPTFLWRPSHRDEIPLILNGEPGPFQSAWAAGAWRK